MNNTLILKQPAIFKCFISLINWRIVLRIFLVLSILSVFFLLVFYVFQVNAEVSEKYLIQKYNGELSQALEENQNLEISLIQSNSLDNIMALMEKFDFERTNKIHYIQVLNNKVVITK